MSSTTAGRRRRLAGAVATAAALSAAIAPAAHAGTAPTYALPAYTPESALECTLPSFTQAFASLGDRRSYTLAPGGDFAAGHGWQLYDGATVEDADQRDGSTGAVLELPPGATAISPYACVDLNYPTARAWTRGGSSSPDVEVRTYYPTAPATSKIPVGGTLKGGNPAWRASGDINVKPSLGGSLLGWRMVAFILTAKSDRSQATQVDDFYIDPRMR